jgi:hypothetical protein
MAKRILWPYLMVIARVLSIAPVGVGLRVEVLAVHYRGCAVLTAFLCQLVVLQSGPGRVLALAVVAGEGTDSTI